MLFSTIPRNLAATCVAVLGMTISADALRAQEPGQGVCFELHPAASAQPPHAPLLLNRCTGETFILVAGSSSKKRLAAPSGYRWLPVSKGRAIPAVTAPAAGTKCFAYDGRKFCH